MVFSGKGMVFLGKNNRFQKKVPVLLKGLYNYISPSIAQGLFFETFFMFYHCQAKHAFRLQV